MNLGDTGLGGALQDGQSLFSLLGLFWQRIYSDPDFAKRYCWALGQLSAQTEQAKNEAKSASGRRLLPAFRRERWLQVVLSPITKNAGDAAKVELSKSGPEIGPQSEESGNIAGMIPIIGPGPSVSGQTTYKFPVDVVSAESLHERAFDPEVILLPGKDFGIGAGSISFEHGEDPSSDGRFRKDVDGGGTVVWLKNAMVDRNYVADYVGYAMGMQLPSTIRNLETVNAFWDLVNDGASASRLLYFVCKALGVPCAEHTPETVLSVSGSKDSGYAVSTDAGAYACSSLPCVSAGSVLFRGEPLVPAVRLVEDLSQLSGALFLRKGFFASGLESGIGFSADKSDVVFRGRDSNGNPKLSFDVYGSAKDVETFFLDCWRRCEDSKEDMSRLLGVFVLENAEPGDVVGRISPLRFFADNLAGLNIVIVDVDASLLDEEGRKASVLLARILETVPPGVCLMFRMTPGSVREECDCGAVANAGTFHECLAEACSESPYSAVSESVETFLVPTEEDNEK